ncbi:uncharacterized protein SCODWIG_00122 [Saccharomycodes ludwigii]|uniref:Striatin N-terminal domain-containing protein n=1 Tax=Saccharomycodes ludwigii TaxID=36035 RepID=A0A376B153_9ASCO|nr:uncharacterized protein SCODWIG_00122 [Saccharomycodes ludwigii]
MSGIPNKANNNSAIAAIGNNTSNYPISVNYTLPGVMHYLQTQFTANERARIAWELEKGELKAKIALLEGENKNLKRQVSIYKDQNKASTANLNVDAKTNNSNDINDIIEKSKLEIQESVKEIAYLLKPVDPKQILPLEDEDFESEISSNVIGNTEHGDAYNNTTGTGTNDHHVTPNNNINNNRNNKSLELELNNISLAKQPNLNVVSTISNTNNSTDANTDVNNSIKINNPIVTTNDHNISSTVNNSTIETDAANGSSSNNNKDTTNATNIIPNGYDIEKEIEPPMKNVLQNTDNDANTVGATIARPDDKKNNGNNMIAETVELSAPIIIKTEGSEIDQISCNGVNGVLVYDKSKNLLQCKYLDLLNLKQKGHQDYILNSVEGKLLGMWWVTINHTKNVLTLDTTGLKLWNIESNVNDVDGKKNISPIAEYSDKSLIQIMTPSDNGKICVDFKGDRWLCFMLHDKIEVWELTYHIDEENIGQSFSQNEPVSTDSDVDDISTITEQHQEDEDVLENSGPCVTNNITIAARNKYSIDNSDITFSQDKMVLDCKFGVTQKSLIVLTTAGLKIYNFTDKSLLTFIKLHEKFNATTDKIIDSNLILNKDSSSIIIHSEIKKNITTTVHNLIVYSFEQMKIINIVDLVNEPSHIVFDRELVLITYKNRDTIEVRTKYGSSIYACYSHYSTDIAELDNNHDVGNKNSVDTKENVYVDIIDLNNIRTFDGKVFNEKLIVSGGNLNNELKAQIIKL